MKHPDRVKSDNLKAEALRARQAADQHLLYAGQALSVRSPSLVEAHNRLAEGYCQLADCLDERSVYFAESANSEVR
jgi:hypothetical protein